MNISLKVSLNPDSKDYFKRKTEIFIAEKNIFPDVKDFTTYFES